MMRRDDSLRARSKEEETNAEDSSRWQQTNNNSAQPQPFVSKSAVADQHKAMEIAMNHGHVYTHAAHGPQHSRQQQQGVSMAALHDANSTNVEAGPMPMMPVDSNAVYNNGHVHPHYQQQQPQHQLNHHNNNNGSNSSSNRPQISPSFYSRSSPIAIIHNPEDPEQAAKLRWQHPMYDTSDDEMDEDDFLLQHQSGVSIDSLTSPPEAPSRSSAPQSLPTALLRAPKLSSLQSSDQDYRLHHLATLPPPMCLSGAMDIPSPSDTLSSSIQFSRSSPRKQSTADNTRVSQTYVAKPKYLSSYGSLRESHLSGKFGGQSHPEYSTTGNQVQVRFEPPPTLIPPRNLPTNLTLPPASTATTQQQPSTESSPLLLPSATTSPKSNTSSPAVKPAAAPAMSIRDRMMQKKKEMASSSEQQDQSPKMKDATNKSPPSSSLSAMLEASEEDYQKTNHNNKVINNSNDPRLATSLHQKRQPAMHRSSLGPGVLPPGFAQAVAISYSSNLHLFSQQRQRDLQEQQQSRSPQEGEDQQSAMLSSSMTGLEILRAASKSRPERPTSLSILQDSSSSGILRRPPPSAAAAATEDPAVYQSLARTMSEPSTQWEQQQALLRSSGNGTSPSPLPQAPPLNSSSVLGGQTLSATPARHPLATTGPFGSSSQRQQQLAQQQQFRPAGMVQTSDGRVLIPPRKASGLGAAIQQHDTTLAAAAQEYRHPQLYSVRQQQPMTGVSPASIPQQQYSLQSGGSASTPITGVPTTTPTYKIPQHGASNDHDHHHPGDEPNPDTQGAFDMDLE